MSATHAFSDIHRSLIQLGHDEASIFHYLGLPQEASVEETEAALATKRRWAQSQQSNPKHRAEAAWLIRNHRTLQHLLLQERADYIRYLESQAQNVGLDQLELFMRGALLYGPPGPSVEQSIFREGERLGVSSDQARLHLHRLMDRLGLHRPVRARLEMDTLFPERTRTEPTLDIDEGEEEEEEEEGMDAGEESLPMEAAPDELTSQLQPQLRLEGPPILSLTLWGATPISVDLRVANDGAGRMSGEVRVDQPWIRPEPGRLDPGRTRQTIRLRAEPELIPLGRSRCLVTVSTPRGGTQSVTVEIYHLPPAMLLGVVGLFCLMALLLAAWSQFL